MKNTILILLIVFSLKGLMSCNNDDDIFTPTLPLATQIGANTIGCYIDSKLLVPRDGDGTFNLASHGAEFVGSGNEDVIIMHDYRSGNAGLLSIHIIDLFVNEERNYLIFNSNCEEFIGGNPNLTVNLYCRWKDEQTGENKYYCSIENTGTLIITRFDLPSRIVSGTFSCSAVNKDDPNDIIEITEGRFDFHWATINEKEFP